MMFRATQDTNKDMIYLLGSATSYDMNKVLPDVDIPVSKLTVNNFIVTPTNKSKNYDSGYGTRGWLSDNRTYESLSATAYITLSKSYNANTGVFTCNITTSAGAPGVTSYLYLPI